jgi:hypothetical protein
MSKKGEEILRQRKENKQKKLLLVLGPIFLLLMIWQGPGYVNMLTGGGSSEPTAATTSTPTPTGATPDPGSAPPPSTAAPDPSAVPPTQPAADGLSLPDSDQPLGAETGQLISFGRFLGKDPFKQGVAPPPTSDGSTPGTAGGSGSTGGGGTVVPPPTSTDGGGGGDSGGGGSFTTASTANIRVNGTTEAVKRDTPFPTSDPLFQLVSLTNTTAKIGLVAGSFSNGKKTVTLKLGKVLTLVSEPDGLRYRLKLISIKL